MNVCIHRRELGGKKIKLHIGASRQDTSSKYTHFLISHIGHPAAPQETNNGLVITPCQHTKELLTSNRRIFTTEKHAHLPLQFTSNCTKGLPEEWSLAPTSLLLQPLVVSLSVRADMCHSVIKHCSSVAVSELHTLHH